MDQLTSYAGYILGFGSVGLVLFAIAFVLAKTLGKNWPYKVALALTVIAYAMVFAGLNHVSKTG